MRVRSALVVALLLVGCGHVTILTNDADARIYADGRLVGRGEAKAGMRTGIPRTMHVRVESKGATVERDVKRSFTGTTLLLGISTFWTGFLWGWQYPESVIVWVPAGQETSRSEWDEENSAWDAAPSVWDAGPETAPTAPPAPGR